MKRCPQCNRTYAEDFAYCLDDGTPLRTTRNDEATLVIPEPQPQPPAPVPSPAPVPASAPAPTPPRHPARQRSVVAIVLGVLGMLLIVLLWGAIKLGLWWLDHNQNVTNQNYNSAPVSVVASPSPSPSPNDPLSLITRDPSPSPDASIEIPPVESMVSPGVYQCEITRSVGDDTKHTVALKLRVTFNIDGTYATEGYMTIPEAGITDQLGIEERGNYSQSEDTLILTNRKERQFDLENGSWKPWSVPHDGSQSREKVRSVTPNTFQLYDNDEKGWFTFSRV